MNDSHCECHVTVNDQDHILSVSQTDTLLDLLRNHLGLNSPRYGCGAEQCGACTVLVNGEPAFACTTLVCSLDAHRIETVESLGGDHPLQQAIIEYNAGQCGFCLSGIIMQSVALLRRNRDPTRDDITRALAGHLCRCGAHNRIIRAIQAAAASIRTAGVQTSV
jgi:nicotinate dehydrogenase subunit A